MKKIIVISAINFRSGGPLSILHDLVNYLDTNLSSTYRIIVLVHSKSVAPNTKNIDYIEFPKSVKSYLFRFYYEYFYFNKLSIKFKPYLWLSLHDVTPRVNTKIQAVYCHNPSPFYNLSKKEFYLDKSFTFQKFLYKYIYRININRNNFVIVQQNWIKDEFKKMFGLKNIIVANPSIDIRFNNKSKKIKNKKKIFFYPSFPRIFKNFDVLCDSVNLIDKKYHDKFELLITISGSENKYSNMIYKKFKNLKNIKFIGLQTRKKVFEIYQKSDCLIFPSKLETWGLPLSEYKLFKKPIIVSDLPYAHETVGNYDKAKFFKPDDKKMLSKFIVDFLNDKLVYDNNVTIKKKKLFSSSYEQLFKILLRNRV